MEFLAKNWWYLLLVGGMAFMMFKGGGCCGGGGRNSHSGCDDKGQDHTGHKEGNKLHNLSQDNNQIEMVVDPVCGMAVDPNSAIKQNIDGNIYYFCSEACRNKFLKKK